MFEQDGKRAVIPASSRDQLRRCDQHRETAALEAIPAQGRDDVLPVAIAS
jgi:hypothetical protein